MFFWRGIYRRGKNRRGKDLAGKKPWGKNRGEKTAGKVPVTLDTATVLDTASVLDTYTYKCSLGHIELKSPFLRSGEQLPCLEGSCSQKKKIRIKMYLVQNILKRVRYYDICFSAFAYICFN